MAKSYEMYVHHSGAFLREPLRYEFAETVHISTPKISYVEFVHLIQNEIGNTFTDLYYLVPGVAFENIRKIVSEESDQHTQLLELFDIMDAYGAVDVYVDHHSEDLTKFLDVNEGEAQFQGEGQGTSNNRVSAQSPSGHHPSSSHAHTHTFSKIYVDTGNITGYTFKPKDAQLIEFVVRLNDGKETYPNRVAQTDLFDRHPAVVIRNHDLRPCMQDTRNYYLFYCKVPDGTSYNKFGYHRIEDRVKGVWEATSYASIISCDLSDNTKQKGEVQKFSYKPLHQSTNTWRMVLYGLPDPQSKMVICKVFETADSKTAKAVRNVISAKRDLEECLNTAAAEANKIELLEAALQDMRSKHCSSRFDIRGKTRVLAKKVRKRNHAEYEEADVIEPTNRGRKRTREDSGDIGTHADMGVRNVRQRARSVAREYLKILSDPRATGAKSSPTNNRRWLMYRNTYGQTCFIAKKECNKLILSRLMTS